MVYPKRDLNSEEDQISPEEFNKLLDNPPEQQKSRAQIHRERLVEIKQQQEEIKRARKEAAEERVKQLNQDREQHEQKIFKQVEELKQWQQSLQSSQNSDLEEEDGENENSPIPANIEAEEAILGSIFFDPMAMTRVEADLRIEAFYFESHQEIYRAALTLYRQQKPTDFMAISTYLNDRDLL